MSDYSVPWRNADDFSISISNEPPSESMDPFLTLFAEVTVNCPELCESLDGCSSVELAPPEYYHITIKQIGEYEGDLDVLVNEIEGELSGVRSFDVNLNGVDVFPNCIYVPVEDENQKLLELHKRICSIDGFSVGSFEGESYKPHMTVGKFVEQPDRNLFEVLTDFRDIEWGSLTIDKLHLVKDGTQSVGPFTTFQSVEEFDLGD